MPIQGSRVAMLRGRIAAKCGSSTDSGKNSSKMINEDIRKRKTRSKRHFCQEWYANRNENLINVA